VVLPTTEIIEPKEKTANSVELAVSDYLAEIAALAI
jgi:hypothetical protein